MLAGYNETLEQEEEGHRQVTICETEPCQDNEGENLKGIDEKLRKLVNEAGVDNVGSARPKLKQTEALPPMNVELKG